MKSGYSSLHFYFSSGRKKITPPLIPVVFFSRDSHKLFSRTIFLFILPPIHLSSSILIYNRQIDIQSKQKCKTNKTRFRTESYSSNLSIILSVFFPVFSVNRLPLQPKSTGNVFFSPFVFLPKNLWSWSKDHRNLWESFHRLWDFIRPSMCFNLYPSETTALIAEGFGSDSRITAGTTAPLSTVCSGVTSAGHCRAGRRVKTDLPSWLACDICGNELYTIKHSPFKKQHKRIYKETFCLPQLTFLGGVILLQEG